MDFTQNLGQTQRPDPAYGDSRNYHKPLTLRSTLGEIPIQCPRTAKTKLVVHFG